MPFQRPIRNSPSHQLICQPWCPVKPTFHSHLFSKNAENVCLSDGPLWFLLRQELETALLLKFATQKLAPSKVTAKRLSLTGLEVPWMHFVSISFKLGRVFRASTVCISPAGQVMRIAAEDSTNAPTRSRCSTDSCAGVQSPLTFHHAAARVCLSPAGGSDAHLCQLIVSNKDAGGEGGVRTLEIM